jgi:RNA recognition motif-containing protein
MPNDAEGQKAIAELNGGVVEGRNINVTEARPREEKSNNNNKRSFSNNNSRW